MFLRTCFLLACLLGLASCQSYKVSTEFSGSTFFDAWTFYSAADPTHGYVDYVTKQQAFDWGYVKNTQPVYIGCDSWSVSSGSGRGSVRISSNQSWTATASQSYVFALDLNHMPTGCGTWPACGLVGPNWPNDGEIDVIEGVNNQAADQTTLHTNAGCEIPLNTGRMSGSWSYGTNGQPANNCDVNAPNQADNQGCGIIGKDGSMGSPFNSVGGGVYALQWNTSSITAWYFPRGQIPSDLSSSSSFATPAGWGVPYAYFELSSSSCPSSHFQQMSMVFDLTFCGDWAGSVFAQMCPGLGDNCNAFVQNNPSAFQEAYWSINYVKVFTNV